MLLEARLQALHRREVAFERVHEAIEFIPDHLRLRCGLRCLRLDHTLDHLRLRRGHRCLRLNHIRSHEVLNLRKDVEILDVVAKRFEDVDLALNGQRRLLVGVKALQDPILGVLDLTRHLLEAGHREMAQLLEIAVALRNLRYARRCHLQLRALARWRSDVMNGRSCCVLTLRSACWRFGLQD